MTAQTSYSGQATRRIGSPGDLANVTPSDEVDLPETSQMIYIAGAGTLRVTTRGGMTVTTPVLHPGWHPLELVRIHATGTTATGIMAGW